jgi:hypothetical protein
MIPGWHAENRRNAAAAEDLRASLDAVDRSGSRLRIWVTGNSGTGWQCEDCGGYETFTGARATQETALAGAAAHQCPPAGYDPDWPWPDPHRKTGESTMTGTFQSREHLEALAAMQDAILAASTSVNALQRLAGSTCTCRAPHSDDPLAHPQGCPRRAELAARQGRLMCPGCGFIYSGRMTAACTCQHCGHRFPAQDAAGTPLTSYGSRGQAPPHREPSGQPCRGPHPPGYPWPCGCTPLSRHGSLAGIPDPVPPAPFAPYSWPDPIPGVVRVCAGCGLDDHMPYPAGPGALCEYCEARRQASPRALTDGDWRFSAAAPVPRLTRHPAGRAGIWRLPYMASGVPVPALLVLAAVAVVLATTGYVLPAAALVILAVRAVLR